MAAILAAIGGIGTILGALMYFGKLGTWLFRKSPEAKAQEITKQGQDDLHKVEDGGRPV